MKYITLSVICAIVVASCKTIPLTPTTQGQTDFFPLKVGNWWEYEVSSGDSTYTSIWEIVKDSLANGNQYFILHIKKSNTPSETLTWYIIHDTSMNVVMLNKVVVLPATTADPQDIQQQFKFEYPIGKTWETFKNFEYFHLFPGVYKSRITTNTDTTTVPAGTFFPNSIIAESDQDVDTKYSVFAPNIGAIQTFPAINFSTRKGGTRLIRAYVNGKIYP